MKGATAQVTSGLSVLKPRELAVVPSGFYISSVLDERAEQDSVGDLLFSADGESVTHKITLKSASYVGIAEILANSVARDASLRPISIRIKQFSIKETLSAKDRVAGEVNMVFMFDLAKDGWAVPLTEYKASAKYKRAINNLSIVEPTLRNLLVGSMKFINNWVDDEAPWNPKLTKGVKISFRDYLEQHDDTVYYDAARPLVWDDFREKRSEDKFAALVFPSFGYDQRTQIKDGIIDVELVVKVFVVKSASWVGPGNRSNYNLNHEQKHFELVKLVAERFKKKLLSEKLTPDNYQGIINFEYLEFYREMNKVQKEYDDQTSHGTSRINQELWNRRIESELKQLRVEN